jgi:uncharacterized YigZ family protein
MDTASYNVPDLADGAIHRVEQIIKKSRFIATFAHTDGADEAKAFIERVRSEFADARHNCWAYCAGAAGSTAQIGASDDGEPHGTAGRPMLTVLTHSGVGEVSVVVTRYFGGILLGTGGLVKAYQSSVKMGLETLPLCERMVASCIDVTLEHRFITQLRRMLPDYRASIVAQDFGMDATFTLKLPEASISPLSKILVDLTAGGVLIEERDKPAG